LGQVSGPTKGGISLARADYLHWFWLHGIENNGGRGRPL
jgi:hypothetical protein